MKFRPLSPSSLLLGALLLVGVTATASFSAQAGARSSSRDSTPSLTLGLETGYSYHFGKTVQVDAASGATTKLDDADLSEHGGASGAFIDTGLVRIWRGDLGLTASFLVSYPTVFYDLAAGPRYKLHFHPKGGAVGTVSPWLGVPFQLTFAEDVEDDFYFLMGLAAGCDLALGGSNWVLGFELRVNMINPKPVERELSTGQTVVDTEQRLDSIFALVSLGYRLF